MKKEKLIKIILAMFVTMSLASNLFIINLKPYLYEGIIEYNENAVVMEYYSKDYGGIKIPEDVRLFFVKDVDTLSSNIVDLWAFDFKPIGIYYKSKKEIKILWNLDEERTMAVLRHELAHHYYHYNLTDDEMDIIKEKYDEYCRNDKEMYADIVEDYYYFEFG